MNRRSPLFNDAFLSLAAGLALGSLLAAFSAPPFFQAFFGAFVLAALCCFALLRAWRGFGSEKPLAVILLVAFLLRMALGVVFYTILPTAGYADSAVQKAGYLYSDAWERDTAAIKLVQGGDSIFSPFLKQLKSDQYGGLLTITALVYTLFSPDAARPLLITLLASFTMTVGLVFLWSCLKKLFSEPFARIAVWTAALYPEGILLSSSQMREPFLIGLGCIAFWAATQWDQNHLKAFLVFLASMVGLVLFSVPAAMVVGGTCLALVLLQFTLNAETTMNRWTGIEVLTILGFIAIVSGWMWLQPTFYYEVYQAKMGSGMLQELFGSYLPRWWFHLSPCMACFSQYCQLPLPNLLCPSGQFWASFVRPVGTSCCLSFSMLSLPLSEARKRKMGISSSWLVRFSLSGRWSHQPALPETSGTTPATGRSCSPGCR